MRNRRIVFAAVCFVLLLPSIASADVYVNKLWDEDLEAFTVQALLIDSGSITFDRGYQNAYGAMMNLDPGPPFIIEGSIQGAGGISFVSGGFDLTNPFQIYVQPSGGHTGLISLADGVNFVGSPIDPIRIEGPYKINCGLDYQVDNPDLTWSYTTFRCDYSSQLNNMVPFQLSGVGLTAENCRFTGMGPDFFYLMSILDHNAFVPTYDIAFRNCQFDNLDFTDGYHPIVIDNFARLSIEGCQFNNITYDSVASSGLAVIRNCGIYSIKDNTVSGNTLDKFHITNAWAADSAFIRTSDDLPIVANDIVVPFDSALAIGKGSVIKFLWSGGIETSGRLYIDSTVLTSWQDDTHGGNTDLEPPPTIWDKWKTDGGRGITIFPGGRAEISQTKIYHASGAVQAGGPVTIDSCYIADCDGFGLYADGAGADTFRVANTTITRTANDHMGITGTIVYRDASLWPQALILDSVSIIGNDLDGVYVTGIDDQFTSISIRNCRIINNYGYGIRYPADPHLRDFTLTKSVILGNYNTGLYCSEGFYPAGPMQIEGNVVLGNGYGQYAGSTNHGLSITNTVATVVGNTIAYNAGVGLVYSNMDDISQTVVANNILFRNGNYGLFKGDAGEHLLANNAFWDNAGESEELRYQGPSGRIYTVEELQALGGEFVTNMHIDPQFSPERLGQIEYLAYDDRWQVSRLLDSDGDYRTDDVVGRAICPDTLSPSWHYIFARVMDTLLITGNITDSAELGSTYRILDIHLNGSSTVLDAGRDASVSLAYDIDGENRQIDGDENGSIAVDIGADEFDPSAGQPFVRITKPTDGELILADQDYEITWESEGVNSVHILFCGDTEFLPWDTVVANRDASTGSFTWLPTNYYRLKSQLRIVSTEDEGIEDFTEHFGIKGYFLARISPDSLLEQYVPSLNGWSLGNEQPVMWPASWYNRFDYETATDTITGAPYPVFFYNDFWHGADASDFPDWPLFVDAFGMDQCYFATPTGPIYRPSAIAFWADNSDAWGGSCAGLIVSSSLAFFDSTAFLAAWPGVGSYTQLNNLTVSDPRRLAINELFTHQFGEPHYTLYQEAAGSAREALAAIKDFLFRSLHDGRILAIGNTRLGTAHDVLPFQLTLQNAATGEYHVYVYDSNEPNVDSKHIVIDSAANTWAYADFPTWSGADGFCVLVDSISSFLQTPTMRPAGGDKRPLAVQAEGMLSVYSDPFTNLMLIDTLDRRVGYDDSVILEIPDAYPIIRHAGAPGPPRGYRLPSDRYTVALENRTPGRLSLSAYLDSTIYRYVRAAASPGEVDSLLLDSGLTVTNADAGAKIFLFHGITMAADHEKEIAVSDWSQQPGESVTFAVTDGALDIVNPGASNTVPILLRSSSSAGCIEAEAGDVPVAGAGTRSRVVPDWMDPALEDTWIFYDYDDNGTWDDSSLLTVVTDIGDSGDPGLPYRFTLSQNYPNPFNPVTTIEYSLPEAAYVQIEIFNIMGQRVRQLVNREQSAGSYRVIWDGTDDGHQSVATGVYLYRFRAGEYVESKKMLLVK